MAKRVRAFKRNIREARGMSRCFHSAKRRQANVIANLPTDSMEAKQRRRARCNKRTARLAQALRRFGPMPTLESKRNILGMMKARLLSNLGIS